MRVRRLLVAGVAIGTPALAFIAGPVLGAGAGADHSPSVRSTPYPEPDPGAVVNSPPYPVNENGLSYGSGANIDADDPGPAETLAEALAHQPRTYAIPLYAQDGVTVLGSFEIQAGTSGSQP